MQEPIEHEQSETLFGNDKLKDKRKKRNQQRC